MKLADMIRAAQDYDLKNKPNNKNWTRVPDSQVARLLLGAKLAREDDKQRQGNLMPPGA